MVGLFQIMKNMQLLRKTGDIHYIYVRLSEDTELGEGWQKETAISYDALDNAPSLEDSIFQFEETLRNEINEKSESCSFVLCTDGPCHLRQALVPAATKQDLTLADFCHSFFDLKKEFSSCFPEVIANKMDDDDAVLTTSQPSVDDMMTYLNISVEEYGTFGVDHVRRMSAIVQVMISKQHDHKFLEPERIIIRLDTAPCMTSEMIDDDTVVRARGLPWQASDHDVARFFRGLNTTKGGAALVLNPQGRRNGEALVRFENSEQRDLALLRHKHHMGNRYIEVYRATGEEFRRVATGTSAEALAFLSKQGSAIVRMRGLPFTATATDLVEFFGDKIPVADEEEGVLFVKHNDGRPTGDAFVLFSSENTALEALSKHKETLGKRYVEIFKSTAAEVQQVLSRQMSAPALPVMSPGPLILPLSMAPQPPLVPPPPITLQALQPPLPPGAVRNCIRLRGMPYSATLDDVVHFLGDLALYILPHGIHFVLNQQGRPSGDAFIQMASADHAAIAGSDVSKGGCHKKHMGERYVEVFQCSGDEMNIVLMGGSLNRSGTMPPPGMALISPECAPSAIVQKPPPIPPPQISSPPLLVQTPQGTIIMPHPVPMQTGFQQVDFHQPHTIIPVPRTLIHPQPTYYACAPYLPTPPLSPANPPTPLISSITQCPPLPGEVMGQEKENCTVHVRLHGMPYNVTVPEVIDFFKDYSIEADSVRLLYNDKFLPTGGAVISFASMEEANRAIAEKSHQQMGGRYVELFVCGLTG